MYQFVNLDIDVRSTSQFSPILAGRGRHENEGLLNLLWCILEKGKLHGMHVMVAHITFSDGGLHSVQNENGYFWASAHQNKNKPTAEKLTSRPIQAA